MWRVPASNAMIATLPVAVRQLAIAGCVVLSLAVHPPSAGGDALSGRPAPDADQLFERDDLPFHRYNGSFTFVRIRTGGGFGRFSGWAHDYPAAERNFLRILHDLTAIQARLVGSGGNVLRFEDPRLSQFPIAYVSEPDEWRTTPEEAAAARRYLLKGGFLIFDDFFEWEMANLVVQMRQVFPELEFLPLDGSEGIWNAFFTIDPLSVVLEGPRKSGTPRFWGLYEDNDKRKRMLAVAGAGGDIGDLWEWSDRGYFPVDPTNDAYRIGVNYIMYALTH
jgi:hypothetical protein